MTNANITRTEAVANENTAKNVALFLAAPFIGLAYAVLLPFVGIAMLLVTGTKALVAAGALGYAGRLVKNVALLIAALVERYENECQVHLIRNWCYLGSVSELSAAKGLDMQAAGFDADGYKILCKPVLGATVEIVLL